MELHLTNLILNCGQEKLGELSPQLSYFLLSLEQVLQGGCGCPIPGGIQCQAGCGSGQPGLVVGDPAHSKGLELMSSGVLFSPGHSVIL